MLKRIEYKHQTKSIPLTKGLKVVGNMKTVKYIVSEIVLMMTCMLVIQLNH